MEIVNVIMIDLDIKRLHSKKIVQCLAIIVSLSCTRVLCVEEKQLRQSMSIQASVNKYAKWCVCVYIYAVYVLHIQPALPVRWYASLVEYSCRTRWIIAWLFRTILSPWMSIVYPNISERATVNTQELQLTSGRNSGPLCLLLAEVLASWIRTVLEAKGTGWSNW